MRNKEISKFLSLILRHSPQTIEINLDTNGWADVDELILKINSSGTRLDKILLEEIVETNDKKRFAFNEDKSKIRANQGHSLSVNLNLMPIEPPRQLYHGTVEKFIDNIRREGLKPMSRQHVHLSGDKDTATIVGNRRGRAIILEVDSQQMYTDGFEFYLSENKVWLTDSVPSKYINFNAVE